MLSHYFLKPIYHFQFYAVSSFHSRLIWIISLSCIGSQHRPLLNIFPPLRPNTTFFSCGKDHNLLFWCHLPGIPNLIASFYIYRVIEGKKPTLYISIASIASDSLPQMLPVYSNLQGFHYIKESFIMKVIFPIFVIYS